MVMTIMMVTMTMATYVYVYSPPVSHSSKSKAMKRTVELRPVWDDTSRAACSNVTTAAPLSFTPETPNRLLTSLQGHEVTTPAPLSFTPETRNRLLTSLQGVGHTWNKQQIDLRRHYSHSTPAPLSFTHEIHNRRIWRQCKLMTSPFSLVLMWPCAVGGMLNPTNRCRSHLKIFQGFIELFAQRGLESEVTFTHDIPYEQVHAFY